MSILFSIRRIIPRLMTLRRHADICAVLFLCMWIAVLTQKLYICTHDDAWQHKKNVQCILGESVGGLELASQSPLRHSLDVLSQLYFAQRISSQTLSWLHCPSASCGISTYPRPTGSSSWPFSQQAWSPPSSASSTRRSSLAQIATPRQSLPTSRSALPQPI